jgi:hypothetical protein
LTIVATVLSKKKEGMRPSIATRLLEAFDFN